VWKSRLYRFILGRQPIGNAWNCLRERAGRAHPRGNELRVKAQGLPVADTMLAAAIGYGFRCAGSFGRNR
jgi:hypothetical protein